jgi:hypothetical protein
VCDGWNTPVEDLIGLGLLDEVLRRLEALPAADWAVYVTGHSRGGALVGGVSFFVFPALMSGGVVTFGAEYQLAGLVPEVRLRNMYCIVIACGLSLL